LLRLMTLSRRIVAEGLGTALLLAAVVGSGIMGERLAGGNVAIALLANTLATGAMLVTLIFTFGPISGAHFNPAVTLADAWQGGFSWRRVPAYIAAQVAGAFIGVGAAHLMFGPPVVQISQHVRAGGSQLFSEFIATFGLLCVIWGCVRLRSEAVPVAVGLYITGAYWFTASTSFANPAVTLARFFTNTFCRYPSARRSWICRRAVRRRFYSNGPVPLAGAVPAFRSKRSRFSPQRRWS
jgi:glycerol uptake facilitator-like aquaporin